MIHLKIMQKIQIQKIFFSKNFLTSCLQLQIFQIFEKKISKLSCSIFWKGFENKSHQRRAHYLKPRRNGGPIPTGGGSRSPPPALIRVNIDNSSM